VPLEINLPCKPPTTWSQISHCETVHSIASIWLWLSMRFGDAFQGREAVQDASFTLSELVSEGLGLVNKDDDASGVGEHLRRDIFQMIRPFPQTAPRYRPRSCA